MNKPALPDRYEILSELGSGGMGKVYLALDTTLKKSVAIKVLATDSLENDPEKLQRFQREAKAAGRMRHENLVSVMVFGLTPSGKPYLVMEYVEGPTLKQVIETDGAFSVYSALEILSDLASAIAHAHANGVVHRDLKSSNIVLAKYEDKVLKPVLIDFGIALILEDDGERLLHSNLTRTNAIIGSPLYMSPELIQGKKADERSDIYSLGCIFYECLAGHPPYQGGTIMQTMEMHVKEPVPVFEFLEVDEAEEELVEKINAFLRRALAKSPSERFPDMAELCEHLDKLDRGSISDSAVPSENVVNAVSKGPVNPLFISIALAGAILIPLLFFFLSPPAPPEEEERKDLDHITEVTKSIRVLDKSAGEELDKRAKQSINISTGVLNGLIESQNSEQTGKLNINGYVISSAKLSLLSTKSYLSNLIMSDCFFEDPSSLELLKTLNLKYLTVRGSNFDDTAAGAVSEFKALESLEATDCPQVTSKGVKAISRISTINSLEIGGPGLDDEALKHIASMTGLRMLTVMFSKNVSDKGVAYLTGMKLSKLILTDNQQVGKESLKYISTMKELIKLDLRGSQIIDRTGDQLKVLRGLKKLKEIYLLEVQTSPAAIERLKKIMPDCRIVLGAPVS